MSRGPFSIEPGFSNRQAFSVGGSGQINEQETILISNFTSGNPLDVGVTIQANPTGLINGVTDRVNLFVDELRAKKSFAVHSVEGGLALLGGTGFALEVAATPILDSDGTSLHVIAPLDALSVNISGPLITQDTNTFNGLTTFPLVCPQTSTVPSNPEDLINLSYFQNNAPAAAVIFYLNNSLTPAPPISTYALLSNTQDGQPQSSIATSLSGIGTTQLVQTFANTLVNLNAGSFIPSGIWELNIFASADDAGSTTHMNLYWQLFGRPSVGFEVQIGTDSALSSVDATTTEQLKLSLALPYTDISPYESLVVKVYAICNRNNLTSITTYYEGTTTYSHMDTSFAVYVPPNILSLNNVWTGVNQFIQPPVMSGASISSASIPDSALSANVVLKDGTNSFSAVNTFQADTIFSDPLLPDLVTTITSSGVVVEDIGGNPSTTTITPTNIEVGNQITNVNIIPSSVTLHRDMPTVQDLVITSSYIQAPGWQILANGQIQAGLQLSLNDFNGGNPACILGNNLGNLGISAGSAKNITLNIAGALTPSLTISETQLLSGVPEPALGDDSANLATTAFVKTALDQPIANIAVTNTVANTEYALPLITSTATGGYPPYAGGAMTYNPSTSNLTTTTFTGALTGNATTATTATSSTITSGGGPGVMNVVLTNGTDGAYPLLTNTPTYTTSTATLNCTVFNGDLTGNATTATNATTANDATNVITASTNLGSAIPVALLSTATAGSTQIQVDSNNQITFTPTTNTLNVPILNAPLISATTSVTSTSLNTSGGGNLKINDTAGVYSTTITQPNFNLNIATPIGSSMNIFNNGGTCPLPASSANFGTGIGNNISSGRAESVFVNYQGSAGVADSGGFDFYNVSSTTGAVKIGGIPKTQSAPGSTGLNIPTYNWVNDTITNGTAGSATGVATTLNVVNASYNIPFVSSVITTPAQTVYVGVNAPTLNPSTGLLSIITPAITNNSNNVPTTEWVRRQNYLDFPLATAPSSLFNYKWCNMNPSTAFLDTTVNNGTYFETVYLTAGLVVSNIGFWTTNNNTTVITGSQAGLYAYGASALLLASSAVSGVITPTNQFSFTMTVPYSVITSGLYSIVFNRRGGGGLPLAQIFNPTTFNNIGGNAVNNSTASGSIFTSANTTLITPYAGVNTLNNDRLFTFIS